MYMELRNVAPVLSDTRGSEETPSHRPIHHLTIPYSTGNAPFSFNSPSEQHLLV